MRRPAEPHDIAEATESDEGEVSHQIPRHVFASEMRVLKNRRQLLKLTPLTEEAEPVPSEKHGLVGLASSEAAAAPNMGSMNLSQLRFLMAMLNVRLSYWLPNPRRIEARGTSRLQWLSGPGSISLLREALGVLDASGAYVNVSDGGHLENLGGDELLRRRCKVIIAIDGEADPELEFESLRTLMRYSWIDLGARIDVDLEPLRRGKDGLSARHVAIGTIRYGEGTAQEPEARPQMAAVS
jgi:hypothetical protein